MQATNKMQQFSFIDLFTDLFESALHVSGDKLAHLQEHFWLYVQICYNAPTLLPTCDKVEMELKEEFHLNFVTPLYTVKAVYTVKNALEDGRVCRPKHVE